MSKNESRNRRQNGRTPDAILRLRGSVVRFGDLSALDGIDLEVHPGERVSLIGPSGAGKSTLLRLFNGMLRPSTGEVELFGTPTAELSPRALRRFQTRIGTLHQQFDLVGPLQVVHNVNAGQLGRWNFSRSILSLLSPRDVSRVRTALERVGIEDKIFVRTSQLSGGEQQRVAVARILVQDPEIILADEPISNLDPARGREVMDLLRWITTAEVRTLIAAVHDPDLAISHFSRVVGLRAGRIVFDKPSGVVSQRDIRDLYRIASER